MAAGRPSARTRLGGRDLAGLRAWIGGAASLGRPNPSRRPPATTAIVVSAHCPPYPSWRREKRATMQGCKHES
jgi:hypothetical protein